MRFALLLIISVTVTILELTFLPAFFRTTIPALWLFAVVLGLAVLDRGRFWFALLGGIVKDVFSLQEEFTYTLFVVLLFLVIWLSEAAFPLEKAPRRIAQAVVGLAVSPFLWAFIEGAEVAHSFLGRDIAFGALVLVLFAVVMLLRARQERMRQLSHLST